MPDPLSHRHAPQGPRQAPHDEVTKNVTPEVVDVTKSVSHPVSRARRMRADRLPRGPQCSAHSRRTGLPCRQTAMHGGRVCRLHGGAAPHVKAAAALRWSEALKPTAVRTIADLMGRREYPTTQLGASRTVLEYAEGQPTARLEVSQARPDLSRLSEADLAALTVLLQRALPPAVADDENSEIAKENGT